VVHLVQNPVEFAHAAQLLIELPQQKPARQLELEQSLFVVHAEPAESVPSWRCTPAVFTLAP
jgi:hypothetical protein